MATQKPARPCTQARVPARQCMHAARSMQMSWCPRWRPCAWRRGGCRSWRASTRPTCCSTRKKKVRVSHHNAGCSKCQGSQDTGKQRQMHTPICMTTHARTHTYMYDGQAQTQTHTQTHQAWSHAHTCISVSAHVQAHIHVHASTHTHTHMHALACTYTQLHAPAHTHTHTRTHTCAHTHTCNCVITMSVISSKRPEPQLPLYTCS